MEFSIQMKEYLSKIVLTRYFEKKYLYDCYIVISDMYLSIIVDDPSVSSLYLSVYSDNWGVSITAI